MHLSSLERYEIQAEAFRRMTGHLAPGKDAADCVLRTAEDDENEHR